MENPTKLPAKKIVRSLPPRARQTLQNMVRLYKLLGAMTAKVAPLMPPV